MLVRLCAATRAPDVPAACSAGEDAQPANATSPASYKNTLAIVASAPDKRAWRGGG
jgi:hypothetical protein